MITEAAISMLVCARIGAVHSIVFCGFISPELAVRLNYTTPKVMFRKYRINVTLVGPEASRDCYNTPFCDNAQGFFVFKL